MQIEGGAGGGQPSIQAHACEGAQSGVCMRERERERDRALHIPAWGGGAESRVRMPGRRVRPGLSASPSSSAVLRVWRVMRGADSSPPCAMSSSVCCLLAPGDESAGGGDESPPGCGASAFATGSEGPACMQREVDDMPSDWDDIRAVAWVCMLATPTKACACVELSLCLVQPCSNAIDMHEQVSSCKRCKPESRGKLVIIDAAWHVEPSQR